MIYISICDDNIIQLEDLRIKVNNLCRFENEISCFSDAEALIENIKLNKTNIIILDIKLQKENGIEVADIIHNINKNIIIIFISGYNDYFEDAYNVEHIYFLTKPVKLDKLSDALNKAYDKYRNNLKPIVYIKLKSGFVAVDMRKVLCFESRGRNVIVHSENCNITIPAVKLDYVCENYIAENYKDKFLRCHQSYIVNMTKFEKYSKGKIFIDGFGEVPVSRKYQADVNAKLAMLLGGYL